MEVPLYMVYIEGGKNRKSNSRTNRSCGNVSINNGCDKIEGEIIIVALISTLGGLAGIQMLNHNWFKRQDIKYRYQLKRAKIGKKYNMPVKQEQSTLSQIGDLIPIIKNLDPDQIGGLIDMISGEGIPESGGVEGLLDKIPPEVIDGFLKGLAKKENRKDEKAFQEFPNQV